MSGRETRDRRLDGVRSVQDVLRKETEGPVPGRCSSSIAAAVLALGVPGGVVGPAVALDDEPLCHDEVDATDEWNPNLGLPPQTETAEHEPHDRLGPGFCGAIHEPSKRLESAR